MEKQSETIAAELTRADMIHFDYDEFDINCEEKGPFKKTIQGKVKDVQFLDDRIISVGEY